MKNTLTTLILTLCLQGGVQKIIFPVKVTVYTTDSESLSRTLNDISVIINDSTTGNQLVTKEMDLSQKKCC